MTQPEALTDLAFRVMGKFSQTQWQVEFMVKLILKKRVGALGETIADCFFERLTDRERLRLFKSAVEMSGIAGVPVDRLVTAFTESKRTRDKLAHSQSFELTEHLRAEVEKADWRLLWFGAWCSWIEAEMGLVVVGRMGQPGTLVEVNVPRPPVEPTAQATAGYYRRQFEDKGGDGRVVPPV